MPSFLYSYDKRLISVDGMTMSYLQNKSHKYHLRRINHFRRVPRHSRRVDSWRDCFKVYGCAPSVVTRATTSKRIFALLHTYVVYVCIRIRKIQLCIYLQCRTDPWLGSKSRTYCEFLIEILYEADPR